MKSIRFRGTLFLLLMAGWLIGSAEAAVVDRVTIVSPDSGATRGIDSVLVVETAVRVTQPDSGLAVFFWLIESGVDSLVLADTTTFGATPNITDSIKTAIGASAAYFAGRAPTSFVAARRARQASLTPVTGDGDSISFAVRPDPTNLADSLIFTWHCKIPASTGTFGDVRAAVVVHDPSTSTAFSSISISPASNTVKVDGDRPNQGTMTLDSVTTGGGTSVSGFSATSSRAALGIGDTVKIAYNLASMGDAVLLEKQLGMVTSVFGKAFVPPNTPDAKATFNLVLSEGDFGDLVGPASVNSDTIAFYLVDDAGNLSSVGVDDVVPTGVNEAVTFVVDAQKPLLDGQVADGDTLLPAGGDTLTDGSLNDGFDDDDHPLIFNIAESLDSLVVRFDGSTDATIVLKSGLQLNNFSLRRASGSTPSRRIDFTHLGDPDSSDTVRVASLDGITQELFSAATGNLRVGLQGDSLRTGIYNLAFQATDLAGNVGPELSRTNVYLDVDDIDLVRLSPSSAGDQDTLNTLATRVSFRLSEPADSVLITYTGIGGSDAGAVRTRILSGTQLTNTTSAQEFEVDGLADGSRYTFSVLARDLAGNFTRSRMDTFVYNSDFSVPTISSFSVAASQAGLKSPILAGEEVTLTIQARAGSDRNAITYAGDAVLNIAGSSVGRGIVAVTADGKSPDVVDQGGGRILLSRVGWTSGRRSLVIRDTTAADTLRIAVADSSDPAGVYSGTLDSVIVVAPQVYSQILVAAPDAVVQGEPFWVDVTLADRFGNRRYLDDRFVSVSASKLGIEIPPGDLYIEKGHGGFWAKSPAWSGEGLEFVVKNLLSPTSFPDSLLSNGPEDSGRHYIVGRSNQVAVAPDAASIVPPLDPPNSLVAEDYMGADGKGDQGGFLLISFDLSEAHETLTGYRIWREIIVAQRATTPEDGSIDAGLIPLDQPVMKYIPWGRVDPVPGVKGSMDVIVATLDTVATHWGVSAERGRETTAAKRAFDNFHSPTTPYELMASTMRQSKAIAQAKGPMFAQLTPQAIAFRQTGVAPRLKEVDPLQSAKTYTTRAVGAVDNIAPEPVPQLRAFDTPGDAGGSITLRWTRSPSDRLLSQTPARAVGGSTFTTPGVQGYRIFRRADGEIERQVGSTGPQAISFVDATTFNGVSYTYRVSPHDDRNAADTGPEETAVAIRNQVFDANGDLILGLLAQNSRVDFDDFFALAARFGQSVADPQFEPAFDLSPNNRIGLDDFQVLTAHFGRGITASESAVSPRAGVNRSARLELFPSGEAPHPGEEFAVDLRLTDFVGVQGYGFEVRYPTAALEFVRVLPQGGDLGNGALARPFVVARSPGNVAIGAHGSPLTAGEIVLRLVFRATEEVEEGLVAIADAQLSDARSSLNAPALPEPVQIKILPAAYGLQANYPNPFNPKTTIRYQLPEEGLVKLEIYSASGQLVRTLIDERRSAGRYAVQWDALDDNGRLQASGLYFYRLQAGPEFQRIRKMLLLK